MHPDQYTPLTERPCLVGRESKSRDVVQPRPQRQEYLFKGARLPHFVQFVQRYRARQVERPALIRRSMVT